MKKSVLIFACLLSFNLYAAEDYTPVFPDRATFFNDQNDLVQGIKTIETYEESGGMIYEFAKNWNFEDYECVKPTGISWPGPKVFVIDEDYYFFNRSGDSILIKPFEEINSPWKCYDYGDGYYIEAQISEKVFMELPEMSDTVKIIKFNKMKPDGNPVSSDINNAELAISKSYGFFNLICFADFPRTDSVYTFMGITNPKEGRPFIWKSSIYDFDIGDEFHRKSYFETDYCGWVKTSTLEIKRVLDITIDNWGDKVYKMERYRDIDHDYKRYDLDSADKYHKAVVDTVEEYNRSFKDIALVTGEAIYPGTIIDDMFADAYKIEIQEYDKTRMVLSQELLYLLPSSSNDTCWSTPCVDGEITYTYLEGCGLFEQNCIPAAPGSDDDSKLVYFKKGDKEWGERLEIKEEHRLNDTKYSIYPNPVENGSYLRISSNNFSIKSLRIINVPGITVYREDDINSSVYLLNTNGLAQGFYFLEIIDINGNVDFEKIIIR